MFFMIVAGKVVTQSPHIGSRQFRSPSTRNGRGSWVITSSISCWVILECGGMYIEQIVYCLPMNTVAATACSVVYNCIGEDGMPDLISSPAPPLPGEWLEV